MKPLTRKEMLLNAAANGTLDNFEPATREEVFTKEAFANAGSGVTSWNDLTDKPFGEEVEVKTLANYHDEGTLQDIAFASDTYAAYGYIPATEYIALTDGMTIHVVAENINSADSTIRKSFEGDVVVSYGCIEFYISDGSLTVGPFRIYSDDDSMRYKLVENASGDGAEQHWNITMTSTITKITPLPTKYLPEHLQFGEENEEIFSYTGGPNLGETGIKLVDSNGDLIEISVGDTFNVLFDGIMYEKLTATQVDEYVCVGGTNTVPSSDDEIPFRLTYASVYNSAKVVLIDGETHSVTVYKPSITPLDPKYLPVMTVNVTGIKDDYTATMDKTYSEIREHIDNGGEVDCVFRVGTSATYHKLHISGFNNSTLSFIGYGYSMTGVNELASFVHYILRIGDNFANWAEVNMLA